MPTKTARAPQKKGAGKRTDGEIAAPRWGPRADKGDGEAAIQARIAALAEPSRSILARLHPMVMKHAKGLDPTVRYGFAIYMRGGEMVLVVAPRKAYVTFGYANDAGLDLEPVKYTSADQVDEKQVAAIVGRLHG